MKYKIGINSNTVFIRSPKVYYQIVHDFKTKMIVICYSTSQCGWVVYSESHTLGGGSGA